MDSRVEGVSAALQERAADARLTQPRTWSRRLLGTVSAPCLLAQVFKMTCSANTDGWEARVRYSWHIEDMRSGLPRGKHVAIPG